MGLSENKHTPPAPMDGGAPKLNNLRSRPAIFWLSLILPTTNTVWFIIKVAEALPETGERFGIAGVGPLFFGIPLAFLMLVGLIGFFLRNKTGFVITQLFSLYFIIHSPLVDAIFGDFAQYKAPFLTFLNISSHAIGVVTVILIFLAYRKIFSPPK